MMRVKLSTYELSCTNSFTGETSWVEVEAMNLGEAIHKVERDGIFVVEDGKLI